MAGSNFFESIFNKDVSRGRPNRPRIFISHRTFDKPFARAVARVISEFHFDIYFDERDQFLQTVTRLGEDEKIVACIKDGIENSTHLLGILTPVTRGSWWVPWEIGYADSDGCSCAHLIAGGVLNLPSYVKVAPVLKDLNGLREWLEKIGNNNLHVSQLLMESTVRDDLRKHFPDSRSDLKFV